MKTFIQLFAVMVLVFMTSCSTTKTTPETIERISRKVETRDFTVKVRYANPTRWRQVNLTSDYDLRIKNDSAFSYLPYFGVAYSAPYSPMDGGIKFAEPMNDYSKVANKRGDGWIIKFKVNTRDYNYSIVMEIFNNGSASFTVSSYQRTQINFHGEVDY